MKKNQSGIYVPFPNESYSVRASDQRGKRFNMDAKALYLTWDYETIFMNYAGDKAGDSYSTIQLPRDPDFLRVLAVEINKLADSI
ncbi:hypothetical protein SJI19_16690 [Acerihabitans sp. TG2]|uniref:hypothetical protein n=1 Tax=Acerihabitans sp. TG2 TaxID=3096008 RepID=UPI002B23DCE4|nr:hypothetical protein [Acerihabitans sp. TG2]MEA9392163.1 hypothetical protein [Acerihabitans sp. TG2]